MGVSYVTISLCSTVLSYAGLHCWTTLSPGKLILDGLVSQSFLHSENVVQALDSLLDSYTSIALVANFTINIFVLAILSLKTIFFAELHSSESRKLVERLINYVIYKGTFLPLVVPPTIYQGSLWTGWLVILCSLKMFQALARDRLDRLNASPSATPWTYFRVYSVLLLVFFVDLLWIRTCLMLYGTIVSSMFFLLFYEPLSILFETLQAIVVHGFQLLDIWLHNSSKDNAYRGLSNMFDISAGSLSEWKGILVRNLGFVLDMMTLLMALGHYVHIWWLHGMAFHLVDAVLFLNIRALLSAIVKRVKGFIKLTIALGTLHGALPDATHEELQAYDDECAICREPMAKAKKLSCHHLFHLACLRSWLDQGLNNNYLCPTCRKPLFVGRSEDDANPRAREVSSDEQLARLDDEGQGVIHLAAALGFEWAVASIIAAGISPNFRDAKGKTALHWASYYGREDTVIVLVKLGAATGAVEDPTPEFPGGQKAADLASSRGHKGIAGFLAETDLVSHLSSLTFNGSVTDNATSGITSDNTVENAGIYDFPPDKVPKEETSLRGSLAAVRNSAHAASLIEDAFRVRSYRHRQMTKSNSDPSENPPCLVALGCLSKVQKMHDFDDYLHSAAAIKIQKKYRGWKGRKEFLKIRKRIVNIQAHVRGHQVRKHYKKVVWSASILEKVILRWRRKKCGLRGYRSMKAAEALGPGLEKDDEYDFLQIGRKQKAEGVKKALARVRSMARNPEARDQYLRLVRKFEEKESAQHR